MRGSEYCVLGNMVIDNCDRNRAKVVVLKDIPEHFSVVVDYRNIIKMNREK